MNNFTLAQKLELEAIEEAGGSVITLVYNPETLDGSPEADILADGYKVYYREDTPTLVEVIYTK